MSITVYSSGIRPMWGRRVHNDMQDNFIASQCALLRIIFNSAASTHFATNVLVLQESVSIGVICFIEVRAEQSSLCRWSSTMMFSCPRRDTIGPTFTNPTRHSSPNEAQPRYGDLHIDMPWMDWNHQSIPTGVARSTRFSDGQILIRWSPADSVSVLTAYTFSNKFQIFNLLVSNIERSYHQEFPKYWRKYS